MNSWITDVISELVYGTMFTGGLNFPMSHPHFRGNLLAESRAIGMMLSEADTILAVGAKIFVEAFYAAGNPLPEGCRLIQLDSSAWEIGKNFPASVGLLGDPKPALEKLSVAVASKPASNIFPSPWVATSTSEKGELAIPGRVNPPVPKPVSSAPVSSNRATKSSASPPS